LHRRSTKANQVAGSSRRLKEPLPDVPPLFRSDPEDNFRSWKQNCSMDASLTREDAIREWLARPVDARILGVHNNRVESSESNTSEMTGATVQEARDGGHSKETGPRNPKGRLGSSSELIDGSEKEDPFVERFALRTQHHSKLPLKFVEYSVLGLLIVTVLWANPTHRVASRAGALITTTQPSKAEATAAPGVSVPQEHEATTTGSDLAIGLITVENISIACEYTQPCLEIRTHGKGALPKLSTLSDPGRVVMDFQDTVFPSAVNRIAVGRGCVKAVRSAEDATKPPHLRVVIDLTEPCDYELQALTNRLVLKVYPRQPLASRDNRGQLLGTSDPMSRPIPMLVSYLVASIATFLSGGEVHLAERPATGSPRAKHHQ
jgi:hypothetical protein